MTVEDTAVQRVVEAICVQGCTYVNACIEALARGLPGSEYADLDPRQRRQLLEELRSLMAVYEMR